MESSLEKLRGELLYQLCIFTGLFQEATDLQQLNTHVEDLCKKVVNVAFSNTTVRFVY